MKRRVVVTGIGVVSPIGIGRDHYWDALFQGKTGFRPITLFDTSRFSVHVAGEITDFDPLVFLGKKGLRDLDRSTRLACSAAKLALDDARLEITNENACAAGVALGTTFGSLHSIAQFDQTGLIEGPRLVNPSHFPNTVVNSPASRVSIRFRIMGFNTTVSTGFCSGLDAVVYAADFIRLQRADVVLAGGVEELCEETFLAFHNLGLLSGINGTDPICCPFDARRNGIVLSEGSALLVLEDLEHALLRQAHILAEIHGYGNAFDPSASLGSEGSGKGLLQAIDTALADASVGPQEIGYISASANSTPAWDRIETAVIKQAFGSHAYDIPVSSVKSMIGETYSASGALSLAATAGAISREHIPPTVNYDRKDPACDLDCVPIKARHARIGKALVVAADPYGNNTAMVVGRFEE